MVANVATEDQERWTAKLQELQQPTQADGEATAFMKKPQSEIQRAMDEQRWKNLKARSAGNASDRLEAVARDHAAGWLTCFPTKNLGTWLRPEEFTTATRTCLGLLSPSDARALRKQGLEMHGRHHAIRDCIFKAAKTAQERPWKEAAVDSSAKRPAEAYLPNWSGGRPLAIDVTVTHPSQSTVSRNARVEGMASEQASVDKA